MTDKERIAALEKALEYAINEADIWYDDDYGGGKIEDEEMDAARALLPNVEWEIDKRDREWRERGDK